MKTLLRRPPIKEEIMVYLVGKLGPQSNIQNSNFYHGDKATTGMKGCAAINFQRLRKFCGKRGKAISPKKSHLH